MPTTEENLDVVLAILPDVATHLEAVKTALDGLGTVASTAATASRALGDSISALDGSGTPGLLNTATNKIRHKARASAIATHDVELAVSRDFLIKKTGIEDSTSITQMSMPFLNVSFAGAPELVIDPGNADDCRILATDQIAISRGVQLKSTFAKPNEENGTFWMAFSLHLDASTRTLAIGPGRGPRLCDAGALLDSLDPFWYKRQIGNQPITRPSASDGEPAQPICDPGSPECRHLRSFLDQQTLAGIAQDPATPVDLSGPISSIADALGLSLSTSDFAVFPNVSVLANAVGFPVRSQGNFSLLEALETIAPTANAGVKIHKSLLDRTVNEKINTLLEEFRQENLGDNQELFATIDSITFEEDSQSIAVVVSVTLKSKEVFSVNIPYVGPVASVTVRVTKDRTLFFRAKPVVSAGALRLDVQQEAVLADPDPDISFEPDLVDILTDPMKDFIESVINLIVALSGALNKNVVLVPHDAAISVRDFRIGSDRLDIFVRLSS